MILHLVPVQPKAEVVAALLLQAQAYQAVAEVVPVMHRGVQEHGQAAQQLNLHSPQQLTELR